MKNVKTNDSVGIADFIVPGVRTATEFFHGYIEGAKNIPLEKLDEWFPERGRWDLPVIVCSGHDGRSRRACEKLEARGVNAINGGDWETLERELQKNNRVLYIEK